MKRYKVRIGIVLLVLIAINFALEPVATHYVNKVLGDIEGYDGEVKDIDIALWRGAYRIDSLKIKKTDGEYPEPFVSIPGIDISVEWRALFHGALKGEVILEHPNLNFTTSASGSDEVQDGGGNNWLETIDGLVPIQINRFQILDGTINYRDYSTTPNVDIKTSQINAIATNLSTIRDKKDKLPTHIDFSSHTSGNGNISVVMDMNLLKQTPDFDLNLELKEMDLTYLDNFTMAYGGFTFEKGKMNVFSEVSMKDSAYVGYVKPLLINIAVIGKDENASLLHKAWEIIIGTVFELFENQKRDQFATKVPFEGDIRGSDVGILETIVNVLRNAFVVAFENQIDQTISVETVEEKK